MTRTPFDRDATGREFLKPSASLVAGVRAVGDAALPVVVSIMLVLSFGVTPAAGASESSSADPSVGTSLTAPDAVPSDASDSPVTASAAGITGTPVSDCTVIDSSGLYHLSGNITAPANQTCLFINASDVVLDGNGYTLKGNGSGSFDGYPILASNNSLSCATCTRSPPLTNVTIKNVRIDRWPRPIDFNKVQGTSIENVVVTNSFGVTSSLAKGRGLNYFKGADHRIVDTRLLNLSHRGIETRRSDNLTIANVTIRDIDSQGMLIAEGVDKIIKNSVVAGTSSHGIEAVRDLRADDMLIGNTTIRSSADNGIRFRGVNASRIRNNTLIDNNNDGIRIAGKRSGNLTISGNAIDQNGRNGIVLTESERSVVQNNTLHRNGANGIVVDQSSSNSSVRNNTVVAGVTNGDGLTINFAGNVTATNNVLANYTRGSGIRLNGGYDGLRASGNAICSNRWGVRFDTYSSGAVTLERNRVASNNQDGVRIGFNVPVEVIDIRHNIIENNEDYGVNYRFGDDGVVPATDNWWGSTDGPSSPGSTTLEDPFTGALANGPGNAVSENDSNAGLSNVHFDPYLTSEPSVAAECPGANEPPTVSVDAGTTSADEGDTATNNGSFADPDGDTVTLNASVGTVTKNADGTWDWSFETTDGPDDSRTVTITATDETGASSEVTFDLIVANVPPSISADDGSVTVDEGRTATNTGAFSDPGNDTVTLSASVGTVTKNADGTWDWSYDTTDGPDQTQTVTITATDSDGDASQTTFGLTVDNRPPSVTVDEDNVTVTEGETATNNGTFGDPGDDVVTLSASLGTVTKNADGTWDWSYDTSGDSEGIRTVTITAEDEDGATAQTSFNLTVEKGLEPGEDYIPEFKGCSEVWIVFQDEDQLPVDATIQVYNAAADAEESVGVRITADDIERIPGQYDDRPVYKFNVHEYFGHEDGDDKVLAVSVGGGPVAGNPNNCADNTNDDENGNGNANDNRNGNGKGR